MGDKSIGKLETRKPAKKQPKTAPRKREDFSQAAVPIVREAPERSVKDDMPD
jgi:hypothetical protein